MRELRLDEIGFVAGGKGKDDDKKPEPPKRDEDKLKESGSGEGGGQRWEDIGVQGNYENVSIQLTLGAVADGVNDAVGALNQLGSDLGGAIFDMTH